MLIMTLLTPITMIVLGTIFIKRPPAKVNKIYGYRTKMSMQNIDTWTFAHHHAGRIWLVTGIIIAILSVVVMALLFNRDKDTVGCIGGIVVLLQCLFMCFTIVFTESALKRKFDKYGRKR